MGESLFHYYYESFNLWDYFMKKDEHGMTPYDYDELRNVYSEDRQAELDARNPNWE